MDSIWAPGKTSVLDDLRPLVDSWDVSLRAQRRSPQTRRSYLTGAAQLLDYLEAQGMPTSAAGVRREHIEAYLADLAERRSASTVATRYRALQQWFKWLAEEGEVTESPMRNMHPPTVPEARVPVLSDDALKRLLGTCKGPGFEDRRDLAILRVLIDTGMRRSEVAGLRVNDVDHGQEVLWGSWQG